MVNLYTLVCWSCETVVKGAILALDGAELTVEAFKRCPSCGESYEDHPRPEGKRLWPPEEADRGS